MEEVGAGCPAGPGEREQGGRLLDRGTHASGRTAWTSLLGVRGSVSAQGQPGLGLCPVVGVAFSWPVPDPPSRGTESGTHWPHSELKAASRPGLFQRKNKNVLSGPSWERRFSRRPGGLGAMLPSAAWRSPPSEPRPPSSVLPRRPVVTGLGPSQWGHQGLTAVLFKKTIS